MLTNSPEYKALKTRVARYLSIDSNDILRIMNPMKNKELPYLLITLVEIRFRSVLLKDTKSGFTVVN